MNLSSVNQHDRCLGRYPQSFYSEHAATVMRCCWVLRNDCAYVLCAVFWSVLTSWIQRYLLKVSVVSPNLYSVFSVFSVTVHPQAFLLSSHTEIKLRSFPLAPGLLH